MPYHLVQHANGSTSVACDENDEIMHPTVGPEIEAQTLYIQGLQLRQRLQESGQLVIWDIGMGAAANALTAINALQDIDGEVEIISFDHTAEALKFALANATSFPFLSPHREAIEELLSGHQTTIGRIRWTFIETDVPSWLAANHPAPAPHAVFFDAWSPKSNPGMWTLSIFEQLRQRVANKSALATYSRATCIRSALLLAGFSVGRGPSIGVKEETTIAATSRDQLNDPLPPSWLQKAERSHSGRPLMRNQFEQARPSEDQLKQLRAHPQFR